MSMRSLAWLHAERSRAILLTFWKWLHSKRYQSLESNIITRPHIVLNILPRSFPERGDRKEILFDICKEDVAQDTPASIHTLGWVSQLTAFKYCATHRCRSEGIGGVDLPIISSMNSVSHQPWVVLTIMNDCWTTIVQYTASVLRNCEQWNLNLLDLGNDYFDPPHE